MAKVTRRRLFGWLSGLAATGVPVAAAQADSAAMLRISINNGMLERLKEKSRIREAKEQIAALEFAMTGK